MSDDDQSEVGYKAATEGRGFNIEANISFEQYVGE